MTLLVELKVLDEEIEKLAARRKETLQLWVDQICPLKVGDVVAIVGYSHVGKQGRVLVVRGRHGAGYRNEYYWEVVVRVLKKDGTDSLHKVSFDEMQWANGKK